MSQSPVSATRRLIVGGIGLAAASAALPVQAQASKAKTPARPALPVRKLKNPVVLDPRDFGAKADGVTKDTVAIQTALDRCGMLGGGEVVLSGGTYLSGAIRIGSRTTLRIDSGATLQGSPDLADYPVVQVRWEGRFVPGYVGLVWAREAYDVALTGKGQIVASSAIKRRIETATGYRHPALLEFVEVKGLSVTDLRTEQNDMWSIHPVYCEDVVFRDVTVHGGADGVDVDSCSRVLIERCDFDVADDCISLKSGRGLEGNMIARPTEDVTILDCVFRDRRWACIGIGSETSAGVRRVLVERCKCLSAYTFAIYIKSRPGRGAFIEDIVMRDLEVSNTGQGFLRLNFLDSGKQDQFPVPGLAGIPTVRNLVFERIKVTDAPVLVEAVNVHPDKPVDGLVLRDITGTANRGIRLANLRNVDLKNINVTIAEGPRLATNNVTGRGLDGAVAGDPTPRPADVVATEPAYRFGQLSGRPN